MVSHSMLLALNDLSYKEQEIYKLQNSLDGSVSGSWIHFMTTEACITTVPQCPLKTGTVAVYSLSVPVSKLYPKVRDHYLVQMFYQPYDECV